MASDPVGMAAAESEDQRIGEVLDARYRILSRLGEGGMGLVYEAQHVFLKSRVALKVLRAGMADQESIERLKREAQSASAIGNPHIVDVRDFGRLPDGSTYVVMELIDGSDLLSEIRRERLGWERARHIAIQVAEALGAAHEQGIVHRDLKPENIILTEKNGDPEFVKIVDFGIARMQGATKLTAAGRVVGTPEYMSPEQCAGMEVDHRADIYALGILMYEMITRTLPFHDPDLVELLKQQLKMQPEPPRKVVPDADIPEAFEAIVLRCLAKRPSRRYQSMDEVREALRTLDAGEPLPEEAPRARVDATVPLPLDSAEDVPVAEARATGAADGPSRRGLLIGLGAAAAIAGAIVVFFLTAAPEETTSPSAANEPPASVDDPAPASDVPEQAEPGGEPDPPAAMDAIPTQVTIQTTPSGAHVYEGDAMLGDTPLPLRRPTDDQRMVLTLRHRGYRDAEIALDVRSSEELHVTLERRSRHDAFETLQDEVPVPVVIDPPVQTTQRRGHGTGFLDPWNQ